jgi:hypothetical protein
MEKAGCGGVLRVSEWSFSVEALSYYGKDTGQEGEATYKNIFCTEEVTCSAVG